MRWLIALALPVCIGAGTVPGPSLPTEIGVLSCTLGDAIDTPASDQPAASEAREMLCSFKPSENGPEETYAGALKSINAAQPLPRKATMLWVVRAAAGGKPAIGFLQQSYAADPTIPASETAPLVGEGKTEISLHPMADKKEGSATKEKPDTPRFAITGMELKLKTSAG